MVGRGGNVVYELRGFGPCRLPADASSDRDPQAAVSPLIRSYDEKVVGYGPVESSPVIVFERAVQLAGHGCHSGNPVIFAVKELRNAPESRDVSLRSIAHEKWWRLRSWGPIRSMRWYMLRSGLQTIPLNR